jgi:hypothetical protein
MAAIIMVTIIATIIISILDINSIQNIEDVEKSLYSNITAASGKAAR